MYNGCLKNGIFSERLKKAKIIQIMKGYTNVRGSHKISPHKPSKCGRENTGKGTDKQTKPLHVFNGVPQQNPVRFSLQTSTIDAIITLKGFVQEGFSKGEITAILRLDVEGALKSARASSVLKNFQESGCPRILYNHTKNYFSKRRATMERNNIKLERAVSKGCPQGSCLGPGMWNIFYNSLLN